MFANFQGFLDGPVPEDFSSQIEPGSESRAPLDAGAKSDLMGHTPTPEN